MTPEGKIKERVKRLLDRYPHYRFMPVQMGMGARTLDFLICVNGRFCAIETKKPGAEPTEQQSKIIRQIREAGGETFVIDGSDIGMDGLEKWLLTHTT
jgi:hypothetical protein